MSEEEEQLVIVPVAQTGGHFVNQGSYGCIFSPPLKCKSRLPVAATASKKGAKQHSDNIAKISKSSHIVQELYAAKFFENAALAKKYFILAKLDTICKELKAPNKQPEPDIMKCDIFNPLSGSAIDYTKLWQYEMEFGGPPLYKKIPKHLTYLPAKFDFFTFMRQMLEIGTFLALNGFVHNDLHKANIVMDNDFFPRVIDFNRSFSVQQINGKLVEARFANFQPDAGHVPPEISAIDGLNEKHSISEIMEAIRNKKPEIKMIEQFLGITKLAQMREFRQFWSSSPTVQSSSWTKFYRLYWPTMDAWGIGHVLMGILTRLHGLKTFYSTPEWNHKKFIVKSVMRGLLRTSPRERIDCVEALSMYDPMNKVLLSDAGRVWLEKKHAMRQRQKVMRGGGAEDAEDTNTTFVEDDELNALF